MPASIEQVLLERRRQAAGEPIWRAYWAAVESSDQDAYEQAWADAEAWVRSYYPYATSFSLDAVLEPQRGISIRTPWNDHDHLVLAAPQAAGVSA